jgi:hypothetical protein
MSGTSTPGFKDETGRNTGYDPLRGSGGDSSFQTTASDTKEALQKKGEEVAGEAKDRAEEMADEQMKIGAEHAQRIAGAVQKAADDLSQSSPLLAHYARSLASGLNSVSDTMRNRPTSRLVSDVSSYASREPLVFFGAAVAAGFALSRFLKSSSQHSRSSGDHSFSSGSEQSFGSGEHSFGRSGSTSGSFGGSGQEHTTSQEHKYERR